MRCRLISFDTQSFQSNSSFRAHENGDKFIDFCPTNGHLLATADSNEVAIWDIRNVTKRLYTIKSPGINSMQFMDGEGINFMVTSGNEIKVLDLRRAEDNYEAVS